MINKRKLVVLLLFSFIVISSVSAIHAADSNSTDVQADDGEDIELEQSDADEDVLSGTRSFSDLNDLINSSTDSEIKLEDDYTYSRNINDDNSIVVDKDNVVIDGQGHTIKGSLNVNYQAYGFRVSSHNVVIKNLNFVDLGDIYQDTDGGAILATSTQLNLSVVNCTFKYCYGNWGGAVAYARNIEDCTFSYCNGECGGAVFGSTIKNSRFNNCQAHSGGAVYQSTAIDSIFKDNYAGQGGAGYMGTFKNCTFDGNSASYGGAVYEYFSNDILANCTFINNEAYSNGGALYSPFSLYDVINCTFENNRASNYAVSQNAYLVFCTFINNTADNNLMYASGSIKTPNLVTQASSYSVYCPDDAVIPINYVYEGCGSKTYYFNDINFAFELCKNFSYQPIAVYNCLSGSSLTMSLDKGTYSLRDKSTGKSLCTIKVYGQQTAISADAYTEMYINDDVNLTASLVDSDNKAMAGYDVYLKENDNVLDVLTTDGLGQVSFSLKNIPAGVHNLNLVFLENGRYEASSLPVTVVVNRFATVIKADDVNEFASDDLTLLVSLTDSENNPMAGFKVYLKENDNVLDVLTTNDLGQVSFPLKDFSAGVHNLYVVSEQDSHYASSSAPVTVTITKYSTSLSADDIVAFIDDDISLVATLLDENNNPMAGRTIYLKEGGNVLDALTTNGLGQVTFSLNDLSAGTHNINVAFSEEKFYAGSDLPVSVVINNYNTILKADNVRAFPGEGVITAKLTDENGNPIADADVTLDIAFIHKTYKTDANGEVQFSLKGLAEGNYDGTIAFEGNRTHKGSSIGIRAEIYRVKTNVYADNLTFVYGESGILTAVLKDIDGNPVENVNLRLQIDSSGLTLKTDANGKVDFDLSDKLSIGTVEADIIFENTRGYSASSSHVTITVTKIPTSISASDLTFTYGEGKYLVATLKDKYGNLIRNANIALKLNSISLSGKTDDNGQARFFLNLPPNTYEAKISFSGNNILASSSVTSNIFVYMEIEAPVQNISTSGATTNNNNNEKASTKIAANGFTEVYNEGKNLVVTLKDGSGKILSNKLVKINVNGQTKSYYTDKNGQIKLSTASWVPKTYQAKITFSGDDKYKASSSSVNVVVKKANAKLSASQKTFKVKSTKKYTVALKNNKNAVMKKVKIYLKVNGKTYSVLTDNKGQATFKLAKLTKKGTYKAVVSYNGNNCYNKVAKTVKIIIK